MNIRNILLASAFVLTFVFSLSFAGNLTARFVDMVTMNPVSGVTAYVYDADNVLVAQQVSDAGGTITVQGLDGLYVIRAVHNNYTNGYFTASVDASQNVDAGDLLLVPLATLSLSVKDNASTPLADGIAKVVQNGNEVVAQVNGASGTVRVSPGDYDVIFSAPFHASQSFHISLAPGDSQNLESSLEPTTLNLLPTLASVTLTLSSSDVDPGSEVELKVVALYTDGQKEDVTSVAQLDVDGAGMLYIPRLVATVYGTHSVRATYGNKSDTKPLSVRFGEVRSLDVRASATSIYTGQTSTLTSYLVDQYSNTMVTQNVTYSTTCGSVQNSVFSSASACNAVITGVYTGNNSINDSVTITVLKQHSGSKGGSSSSGSSYSSSNTSTDMSSVDKNNSSGSSRDKSDGGTLPSAGGITAIKFVFPPTVYVGDTVEVSVLDEKSNFVAGAVIDVKRPDNTTISLVSSAAGKISFVAFMPGDYRLFSTKYAVIGLDTLSVKPVPVMEKPPQESKPPVVAQDNTSTAQDVDKSYANKGIVGTIMAAFSGEISPVEAIRATLPLWLIVGGVMLAAAIFFVVYTFLAGNAVPKDEPPHEEMGQRIAVLQPAVQDEREGRTPNQTRREGQDDGSGNVLKSSSAASLVKGEEQAVEHGKVADDTSGQRRTKPQTKSYERSRIEDEISQLERDLEEKMQRLRELKRTRGSI